MWALLSTYGSRGDVEQMVGFADPPPRAAELVAQFDTVAEAAGGWR